MSCYRYISLPPLNRSCDTDYRYSSINYQDRPEKRDDLKFFDTRQLASRLTLERRRRRAVGLAACSEFSRPGETRRLVVERVYDIDLRFNSFSGERTRGEIACHRSALARTSAMCDRRRRRRRDVRIGRRR